MRKPASLTRRATIEIRAERGQGVEMLVDGAKFADMTPTAARDFADRLYYWANVAEGRTPGKPSRA